MTRRRTPSIAAVLALCLIVPAGALAQKPGLTATQFYLAYRDAFAKAGVVTLTCGTWGNVFRFLPPLSISDDLLGEAFAVVGEAFAATA